jgi:hypothetical protein
MGFLDKMKSVAQAATGGAARVSIEYPSGSVKVGAPLPVKVSVVSTGGEVKSGGIYVDLIAKEHGSVKCNHCGQQANVHRDTINQSFAIAPAFVLGANESKVFEGTINLPAGQPSYSGVVTHEWSIRGRMEAFGNDPDSGFQRIEVK